MPTFRNKPIDVVVDVRSHLEYWLGHLPGAVCIPVQNLAKDVPQHVEISPQSRILVYCASGARSATAVQVLKSLGYMNVVDGGGIGEARQHFA
jgi:rhodanese-related sulfurtransferase